MLFTIHGKRQLRFLPDHIPVFEQIVGDGPALYPQLLKNQLPGFKKKIRAHLYQIVQSRVWRKVRSKTGGKQK